MNKNKLGAAALLPLVTIVASCGGGGGGGETDGGPSPAPVATYTIGGTVSGLSGSGLVLRNNQADSLSVSGNGPFTFATSQATGAAYAVSVATQPGSPAQSCSVTNGSGTVGSAAVTNVSIVCSAVQLTLSSSVSAAGVTALARTSAFTLTFSAAVSSATVTTSSVTLRNSTGDQPVTLTVSGNQVTVTPTSRLRAAEPYTLRLDNSIRGLAGEELAAPIVLSVTTEDGSWAAPPARPSPLAVGSPHIVADDAGGAVMVWYRGPTVTDSYWASSRDGSATWSEPQPIVGSRSGLITFLSLGGNGNGNVYAAWNQGGDTPPFEIWGARRDASGTWGPATAISASPSYGPLVGVDGSGNALAIWSVQRLWSSRTASGVWGPVEPVTPTDVTNINSRDVGVDAAGNGIAVWDSGLSGQTVVNVARFSPATGWGGATQISTNGVSSAAPRVAVASSGEAVAAWNASDPRGTVWASRFTPGQGWGSPTEVAGGRLVAGVHSVAIAPDGNAVVVFTHHDGTRYNLLANRYRPGTGWNGAESVEAADADAIAAACAIENGGKVHVAWEQGVNVWTNRYSGSGWHGAKLMGDGGTPRLAASASGRTYLVHSSINGAIVHRFE